METRECYVQEIESLDDLDLLIKGDRVWGLGTLLVYVKDEDEKGNKLFISDELGAKFITKYFFNRNQVEIKKTAGVYLGGHELGIINEKEGIKISAKVIVEGDKEYSELKSILDMDW